MVKEKLKFPAYFTFPRHSHVTISHLIYITIDLGKNIIINSLQMSKLGLGKVAFQDHRASKWQN